MPSLDLALLLNPSHWMDGNPGPFSPWYWLLVALFAGVTVAGGIAYFSLLPGRFAGHRLHARMAEVAGVALFSLGLWGLFLMLVRFLGIGLISARILVYLTLLAGVGMAAYAVYYRSRLYPARLAAYIRDEERKRYLPKPKSARPGTTPAKKKARSRK